MAHPVGKYEKVKPGTRRTPFCLVTLSFFLVEVFGFLYLTPAGSAPETWPLTFGTLWSVILGAGLCLLPRLAGRILFGLLYGGAVVYSVGQTGYYLLFSKMMWVSEFRYASEGADYLDVIFGYPAAWFVWIFLRFSGVEIPPAAASCLVPWSGCRAGSCGSSWASEPAGTDL